MNQKVAKMLRRIDQATKKGKATWNSFTPNERGELRADYIERGDQARKNYTHKKRNDKRRALGE